MYSHNLLCSNSTQSNLFLDFPSSPYIRYQSKRCTQAVYTSHSVICTMPISKKNAGQPALGR